jgi:hypothetical protein
MRIVFPYLLLAVIGAALIMMISFLTAAKPPAGWELYYSRIFYNGYNMMTAILFLLTGITVGLKTRLSPWLTGIALISVLPVLAIIESLVFRGSHNLIPFELIMYFLWSLPAIAGVYVGRLMYNKRVLRAAK